VGDLRKRRKLAKGTPLENESALDQLESHDTPSLEAGVEFARMGKALNDLSPEHQEVIFLSYFQGYTQQEIPGILKPSLGTVKTHVRSALKKLKESLCTSTGGRI
jgi:RNA polymerase sigma-70 factor (ECF subfamily)